MNSQRENEKQRNGQKRLHSTFFSSLSLLLSAVCCIMVVRLEIKMNLQDRRISDSVTRCNQMETELQTLQRRRQGSDMHVLKTKLLKGKVFYYLFHLHRGHPVNWTNDRCGCVASSFTTLARAIWIETITLGCKIQQFVEVNGLSIVEYGFSLSAESLRACVESFELGLTDKSTYAIQAIVGDGAVILYDSFHACWVAILSPVTFGWDKLQETLFISIVYLAAAQPSNTDVISAALCLHRENDSRKYVCVRRLPATKIVARKISTVSAQNIYETSCLNDDAACQRFCHRFW